jgi:septal ring factor EnvC (AmiA/AmiB activator)
MNEEIITRVLMVLCLGINAFFLRGIFKDLGEVKTNIARIFERSKAKEKRISNNEDEIKDLTKRINELEKA